MSLDPVYRLACKVQEYPWGTTGHDSLVARYASATPENEFKSKSDGTYAELWMGSAHQNGPSSVILSSGKQTPLKEFVLENSEAIFGKALKKYGKTAKERGQMPFLFKTLCAGKALPLQLHPHKSLAEELYRENPEDLPDDNHKPEIGLALSDFQAFASFRPIEQIQSSVQRIPELKELLGAESEAFLQASASENVLRHTVKHVLNRSLNEKDTVSELVKNLAERCAKEGDAALKAGPDSADAGLAETFVMLNEDYKGDGGAFVCAFFMNLYKLKPGEAIYVPASGIHAWFRGDIFECMANSDNVVNVAFTKVDQDAVDLFSKAVLTPTKTPASHFFVKTEKSQRGTSGKTIRYVTPFDEFDLYFTDLAAEETEVFEPVNGPSVVIISKGAGKVRVDDLQMNVKEGQVLLILAGKQVTWESIDGPMQVYRCFAE